MYQEKSTPHPIPVRFHIVRTGPHEGEILNLPEILHRLGLTDANELAMTTFTPIGGGWYRHDDHDDVVVEESAAQ